MNKYKVKVIHIFNDVLDVEAKSEEEARQKAASILTDDNYKGGPRYETTIPPENWPVISEEEFNKFVSEQVEETSNIITPSIITP